MGRHGKAFLFGLGFSICLILTVMDMTRTEGDNSLIKEVPKLKSVGVLPTLRIAYCVS